MEPWIRRLAADLLREYSERLSNDGCNDFDVPSYVPVKELKRLCREWDKHNDDADVLVGYNWAVADAVAHHLAPKAEGGAR